MDFSVFTTAIHPCSPHIWVYPYLSLDGVLDNSGHATLSFFFLENFSGMQT